MFMTGCVVLVCQVGMTKTLTGYDLLVYVKVSYQRHLKQCHICIKKKVITERMTLNDSCHKHE